MSELIFDRDFEPRYGEPVDVAPGVRRLTARNPGPFTFHGTNSYMVGESELAVIDPGPEDREHIAALLSAMSGKKLSHIVVTHTHRDHSGAVAELARATDALVVGPRRRRPLPGEENSLDAAVDFDFRPDSALSDGEEIAGKGWSVTAIATPGHTSDHFVFALGGTGVLFSGDHVMAWSTSIVAPPDGSMADYMRSLDKLLARPEDRYLPGHGGPVVSAPDYVAALKRHRQAREAAIVARLAAGDTAIPQIVEAVYIDTDRSLHSAAALSVLAHLEDLVARGLVNSDGAPALEARYRLTSPTR